MAKFLFGLITGVVLCVVGLFLIFFALARSFRESAPAVAQNSVLQLQLSGDIPERAAGGSSVRRAGGASRLPP